MASCLSIYMSAAGVVSWHADDVDSIVYEAEAEVSLTVRTLVAAVS